MTTIAGATDDAVKASFYRDFKLEGPTFRVLELFPARQRNAPLKGTLHVEILDSVNGHRGEPYEAVSYGWFQLNAPTFLLEADHHSLKPVWGTNSKPCTINVHGKLLPITENLDAALRTFRDERRCRRLWADALCINQQNRREQTHQVALMTEIYREASKTLAWIGVDQSGDLANSPFQVMKELHNFLQSRTPGERPSFSQGVAIKSAFENLISNPYFSRRWILQEVAVARTVEFWTYNHGPQAVPGRLLADVASDAYSTLPASVPASAAVGYGAAKRFRHLLSLVLFDPDSGSADEAQIKMMALLDAVHYYDGFQCQDPRDRIAALLFLADKNFDMRVEYTVPFEEVYIAFARLLAESHHGTLARLLFCAASRVRPSGATPSLQSWVPDWRMPAILDGAFHEHTSADEIVTINVVKCEADSTVEGEVDAQGFLKLTLRGYIRTEQHNDSFQIDSRNKIHPQENDHVLDLSELRSSTSVMSLATRDRALVLRPHGDYWKIIGAVMSSSKSLGSSWSSDLALEYIIR